jgi:hypothetical protein
MKNILFICYLLLNFVIAVKKKKEEKLRMVELNQRIGIIIEKLIYFIFLTRKMCNVISSV